MSDRALQDRVIQYLTDAGERSAGPPTLPLSPVEAARAGRFANFLARHYYRDRLARSFQYSYLFRGQTGRSGEQIADSAEFNEFQSGCVLGSLESAQRVGEMARRHMLGVRRPVEWWPSLIEYEYAYFLQAATSEHTQASAFPQRGRSAVLKHFEWLMPELLARVRDSSGLPVTDQSDLKREATLLFSRNAEGKLFVVEVEKPVATIFNAVDGLRSIDEIAIMASSSREEAQHVLVALANIGAVVEGTQS